MCFCLQMKDHSAFQCRDPVRPKFRGHGCFQDKSRKKVTKKSHLRCSCSFLLLPLLDLSSQGEGMRRHAEALYIQVGVKLLKEPKLKVVWGPLVKKRCSEKYIVLDFNGA